MTHADNLGCTVGRRYRAQDARAVEYGLQLAQQPRTAGFDMFTNTAARMGWGTPNLAESTTYNLDRLSYDYSLLITLYRNHWISRRIVDGMAQDIVRAWPTISSELAPRDIDRIDNAILKTNTKTQILTALKWARLFGGAGALMVIDGHENRLEEPLDLDDVEPGAYRGLIPFDRWTGIAPVGNVSTNIDCPREFNLPERYRVTQPSGGSFNVHASRILRFCGPSVPAPEYQAQAWWGISVIEPAYEEIRKRDNMSWNILSLTFRASLLGMRWKELSQALSGAGMNTAALTQFYSRMESVNQLLSNQSMVILPEDGGLESINYTFSGVADVYQQFQLDIAGASGYPVSRLFGRTISGLSQSNDADERIYEERVAMEQEDQARPQLEKLYPVICMSELGEVPDDLSLRFPGVRVLTEEEKSKLATDTTTNVVSLVNSGIITKSQALKELKQQSDITGFGSNITDEAIEMADREAEQGFGLGEMEPGPEMLSEPELSEPVN